jgi:hypothetical protein
MRYLIFILLSTCSTYQGVITSEDDFNQVARCKINDYYYIWVRLDTDSFEIGDTILIEKQTLKIIR